MLDGNSEDGYGRPLDGAIDGPAGNYAISLFGSQPPQDGRSDKALENPERYRGGDKTTHGQIHQGGVNFKLSQHKCPQPIYTLDFECQFRQVRGGPTME